MGSSRYGGLGHKASQKVARASQIMEAFLLSTPLPASKETGTSKPNFLLPPLPLDNSSMAFLQQGIMTDRQPTSAAPVPSASESPSSFFSQRARRQLGLFFAGAGFFAVSSVITRRSLVRRYIATVPKFYQPSNRANVEVDGAMEAVEALSIATINVLSVGMMFTGGLLYAFDISSLDDMRRQVRASIGVQGPRTDQDAEEEIEEWIASMLDRKSKKEGKRERGPIDGEEVVSILDRISKMEEKRKKEPKDEEDK